jgi:flagellar biosynthesis anti-sigma factor FlgM
MKIGTKTMGINLQVMQNDLAVPVWHNIEQISPVVHVSPARGQATIPDTQPSAMEQGMRIARSQPETRADRVEALMAQIEAGTYAVDCQAIAQKMLIKNNSF